MDTGTVPDHTPESVEPVDEYNEDNNPWEDFKELMRFYYFIYHRLVFKTIGIMLLIATIVYYLAK